MGAVQGLVLRLRTYTHMRAELLLDGHVLGSAEAEALLRGDSWSPLSLAVSRTNGVLVSYRGSVVLHASLPADRWRPAASWRVGFGARTGGSSAEHRIRSIRLRSAMLAASGSVAVEVSVNGGADFSSGGPTIRYSALPMALLIRPVAGPADGGTLITVSGE